MKISYLPYSLELKHQFTISLHSRKTTPAVFVKIEHEGVIGFGEASLPPYLPETQESVISFIKKAALHNFNNIFDLSNLNNQIDGIDAGNYTAKASLNIAFHDLVAKLKKKPVRELYPIDNCSLPFTSMTIGIDTKEMIKQKIEEADEFKILKIKLGSENDYQLIDMIRSMTDKPLFVDANQGWKDINTVFEMVDFLKDKNVLLIEQPMPKNCYEEMKIVKEKSPIPLIADESVQRLDDIDKCKDAFHGINIKLMKCAGIYEAFKMIEKAGNNKMKIMIGCMTESSCAISAAIQLASLCDYADLDGNILIANDPFAAQTVKEGMLTYPSGIGLGVTLKKNLTFTSAV